MPPQDANPTPSFGGFGLSPKSVTEQIAAAKDDKAQLALYDTYLPLGLIIAGVVIASGGVFVGWSRRRKTAA